MAKPKIRTIRASTHPLGTGDFTTIQAWEDYVDDKINPFQWAECYQGFDLGLFDLSGWASTPTSSGYPRIFAASGEVHLGNLNQGPVIAPPSSGSAYNNIALNYARVEGIGSTRGFNLKIDAASNMSIEKCWSVAEDGVCFKAKSIVGTTASSGNVIKNCLAIGSENGAQDIGFDLGGDNMVNGKPQIQCYNCTAYGHPNAGFRATNTKLPGFYGGADIEIKNCISMDCGGIDFSYANTNGNGEVSTNNNLSSDQSADDMSIFQQTTLAGHIVSQNSLNVFFNPAKEISVHTVPGSGVEILPSGDFYIRSFSPARNAGTTISSVTDDIRGFKRPHGNLYDIGAYEYGLFTNTMPLYIKGPIPASSGLSLFTFAPTPATSGVPVYLKCFPSGVGDAPFYMTGVGVTTNTAAAYVQCQPPIPTSGLVSLNIGNFTLKRREPLFIKTPDAIDVQGIGGLGSLFGGLDISGGAGGGGSEESLLSVKPSGTIDFANLFLKSQINISNLKIARGLSGGNAASDATPSASGARDINAFTLDTELANTNLLSLSTQGFSGITGPDSWLYYRNINVNSDKYVPDRREAFMFSASETNCAVGSLYKFDNNTNDNSEDYGFKVYASGWRTSAGGSFPGSHIPESGFFQTSDRFPASSLTGSGVARFKGKQSTPYYGTVLVQSGSPSISDQHRITPKDGHIDSAGNFTPARRGVSTSFWIKRKGPAPGYSSPFGLGIRSVVGNCEIAFRGSQMATSGQWSIYYAGHGSNVKPSGSGPFNSLKNLLKSDSENRLRPNSDAFGGLIPFVNTTAGGTMGHILKTNDDGELIQEHLPDLMIPFDDDRWYFINYWVDTELYKSFVRVASPAKGHPGQSGYMPEIKPITDTSQKWDGYEVKTDTDDIKFKVGGLLQRGSDTIPYSNLGYNISSNQKQQDEFLIDELVVSNKVCSPEAMEQQFDTQYQFYTGQFLKNSNISLFVPGSQIELQGSGV